MMALFDTATALMLVATALTEDAETPLGHAATFGPLESDEEIEPDSLPGRIQQERVGMVDTIATAVRMLEQGEQQQRPEPPAEDLYASMGRLAQETQAKQEEMENGTTQVSGP